ncbi:recombinase family protein [Lysobacter sp. CA199]|uniref:recombinase family protein n=1 Tax=Lysobacter sp. CA199 TaxID=3455608 RepID=UPI003F8D4915
MSNYERKPLRTAVYCHTSSPNSEEIAFQKTLVAKGMTGCTDLPPHFMVYVDDGFCPQTEVRPELQRLLTDVAHGHIDCVASSGWDVLSPSPRDLQKLAVFFISHGVPMIDFPVGYAFRIKIVA